MVWGCSSAGEHFVDIEGVTGSIPVTPTISSKIFLKQCVTFGAFLFFKQASWLDPMGRGVHPEPWE